MNGYTILTLGALITLICQHPVAARSEAQNRPDSKLWSRLKYPVVGAYSQAIEHARSRLTTRPLAPAKRREVQALLTRAIGLNPRRPEAFRLLGLLHTATGQHGKAAEAYRRALTLDPTYLTRDLRYRFAMAAARAGRFAEAGEVLRKLARPTDPARMRAILLNNAAEAYMAAGYLTNAISLYRRALGSDGTYIKPRYGLAVALHRDGQRRQALRILQGALSADKSLSQLTGATALFFPPASRHYHLALAWEARGNTQRALTQWRAFLAADPKGPWVLQAQAAISRLQGAGSPPAPSPRRGSP